jgi:amylosucrase
MTTFYPYQWDLNYANPTVFNDMTANMLFLCNNGVDIVRLDAVPYIWKTLGTNCRNLPQVHTLVRLMHMAADVVAPGTLLLGEVVMEPSKVVPYFGTLDKPECQMLYNVTTMASTWHTLASHSTKLLKHQLEAVFALPKEYTFLNYLRCHDDIGWGLDYDYLETDGLKQIPHKKYLNDYLTGKWKGSCSRGELYNDDPKLGDARLRLNRHLIISRFEHVELRVRPCLAHAFTALQNQKHSSSLLGHVASNLWYPIPAGAFAISASVAGRRCSSGVEAAVHPWW